MNIYTTEIIDFINKNVNNIKLELKDIQKTNSNIEGDYTILISNLNKNQTHNTEEIISEITSLLLKNDIISSFNVIHVFLNIKLSDKFILNTFEKIKIGDVATEENAKKNIVIEYCSPNTNKPLHLGHLRNIFIGNSLCRIMKKCNYNVHSVILINDRGIHICKSMIAYKKFGENKTPSELNIKGDHFVGDFYVKFDKIYKEECKNYNTTDKFIDTPILLEAKELLKKWENKDPETISLWEKMNSWVLDGFNETYKTLGIKFDKEYFESKTYLLGKEIVNKGLNENKFYKGTDNSIWVDLTDSGIGKKLLLRGDGTSVYITQDLGTLDLRYQEFSFDKMLYVVGDEQIHHFKVLIEIAKKLGLNYANDIYHISYGMVELPNGKMKSREGTVVDADDIIQEMFTKSREKTETLNKLTGINEQEKEYICKSIGLNSLRFFLLKVDPKKKITFNPAQSIDFQGDTAPFIMYSYVRICSLLENITNNATENNIFQLSEQEKELIFTISEFNNTILKSSTDYNPSLLAQYILKLSKDFNKFYETSNIKKTTNKNKLDFYLTLISKTKEIFEQCFDLLGLNLVKKM